MLSSRSDSDASRSFRPRFVYFDLDDTLLDHREAERSALRDLACDVLNLDKDSPAIPRLQEAYRKRNGQLWAEYAAGRITKSELRQRRFDHIAEAFNYGNTWSELDLFYMDRYANYWRPVDGAMVVFERVARTYPVGIITNGFADTQHAKLERFPLIRRAAYSLVISEDVGHLKPGRRLFAHAEECAGVPGESILYVGDSLTSDVMGALAAGWRAAWYTQDEAPVAVTSEVFVFRRWPELEEYLVG